MDAAKRKVGTGMHVEIELLTGAGEAEQMAFDIVPDASADYGQGYLGESTPLAKAILGHAAGERLPYRMADVVAVRIVSVTQSQAAPLDELAAERQARFNKAVRAAERSNAVNFASSFSGKWGDYDPDSLPKDEEDKG
jgi:hypothetical protein